MWGIKLASFFARTAKREFVSATCIVRVDVERAVTIRNIDVAVWRHCNVRRPIIQSRLRIWDWALAVRGRLIRISKRPHLLAPQRSLRDHTVDVIRKIEEV